MSEPRPPEERPEDDDEITTTPFDNPFFLPVLLFGLALWFAYDGFFNEEFAKKHPPGSFTLLFNQIGTLLLLAVALWTGFRAWRERQAEQRDANGPPAGPGSSGPPA